MFLRNAATSSTTSVCCRQWASLAGDAPADEPPSGWTFMNITIRSASGKGSGLKSTAFTTEKMAVLAPMPKASAATAVMVKLGLCRNMRSACLRSLRRVSIALDRTRSEDLLRCADEDGLGEAELVVGEVVAPHRPEDPDRHGAEEADAEGGLGQHLHLAGEEEV